MSAHYVDKSDPDLGAYEIVRRVSPNEDAYRWQWTETAKGVMYVDCGQWFATKAEAYRDAASDWEDNGNSTNRRLAGQLRAAATRAERTP